MKRISSHHTEDKRKIGAEVHLCSWHLERCYRVQHGPPLVLLQATFTIDDEHSRFTASEPGKRDAVAIPQLLSFCTNGRQALITLPITSLRSSFCVFINFLVIP